MSSKPCPSRWGLCLRSEEVLSSAATAHRHLPHQSSGHCCLLDILSCATTYPAEIHTHLPLPKQEKSVHPVTRKNLLKGGKSFSPFIKLNLLKGGKFLQPIHKIESPEQLTSQLLEKQSQGSTMSNTIECSLKVIGVDFLRKENTCPHHTSKFKNDSLIVRRGQEFNLKVTFSRELKDNDEVILKLSIGQKPLQSNGTLLSLNIKSGKNDQGWHAKISQRNGKECLISVVSPADAIIGKYVLEVVTRPNVCDPGKRFFYVLFNPWCEADSVFMPDEAQKAEYVLNDTGCLYSLSNTDDMLSSHWKYGQFEEDILDCCMYLLDKSQLEPNDKRDPVKITRAMSALVNMEDEKGVLFGKWEFENQKNPCEGFPCPTEWEDSVRILKQYYRTRKPVLYAQCWVFSGVLNTVMRCLGIPARSVTTYDAGRDTDNNINIDIYMDERGRRIPAKDFSTKQFPWNFHVWNDVWMKRPDLPKGYDGWQAVDGTPQVKSEGIYCCGPASLKAIKNGEVNHDYDTMFLFSAVNAEIVFWKVRKVNGKDTYVPEKDKFNKIGTKIITKAIGNEKAENIIDEYKFPEDSEEEKRAMKTALSHVKSPTHAAVEVLRSLKASIKLTLEKRGKLVPGQPIDLNIVVSNKTAGALKIKLSVSSHLESYAGKVHAKFLPIQEIVHAQGKRDVKIRKTISVMDYMKTLSLIEDELQLKVNIFGHVQETNEKCTEAVTLAFQYPQLQLVIPEKAKVNENFDCEVIFKNTFSIPLENCKLLVEDLDISPVKAFDHGTVPPNGIKRSKLNCTAKKTGDQMIVAKWNSTQVKGITAVKFIVITE